MKLERLLFLRKPGGGVCLGGAKPTLVRPHLDLWLGVGSGEAVGWTCAPTLLWFSPVGVPLVRG